MHIFKLCRGLRFTTRDARICTLDRQTITGQYQLIDESGSIESVSRKELLDRWRRHDWAIDPASIPPASNIIYFTTERDLASYSNEQQAEAQARFEMIQPLVDQDRVTTAEFRSRCAQLRATSCRTPSVRTMQRWLTTYRRSKNISCLVPVQPRRRPQMQQEFRSIAEQSIEEQFLTPERLSRRTVIDTIRDRVEKYNETASESKQIKCPSQATLYRLFRDISAYKADAKRFGVDEARRRNRVAVSVMKTTRLLERIELDHMQVDLLMTDPKTGLVLGRPWLTIAIDHHSRMVLGFHLSFESPNAYAVLHALVQAVLPKQAILDRYSGIKNDWPAMGLPLVIVVDNGMELHGSRIQEFCLETGATLQFCPRVTPWFKPIVERFNRSLNTGLIHELPGTTFSNTVERGKYDSEKHACIDIDTFEEMLVRWIVDEYHSRPHGTLKISPLEAWRRAEKRLEVALPASPADLQLLLGATERRRLHHYGIEFDMVHYNSADLQDLYRRLVGYPGAKSKYQMVSFRVYENIDHIDVLDPDSKEYLRVPARDMEYAQDLRRSTHHLLSKLTVEQYGKEWRPSDRHKVKTKINELVDKARRDKKAAKRLAKAASDTQRRESSRLASTPTPQVEQQSDLFDVELTNSVIDSQQFIPIPLPNFSTSISGDRHAH